MFKTSILAGAAGAALMLLPTLAFAQSAPILYDSNVPAQYHVGNGACHIRVVNPTGLGYIYIGASPLQQPNATAICVKLGELNDAKRSFQYSLTKDNPNPPASGGVVGCNKLFCGGTSSAFEVGDVVPAE